MTTESISERDFSYATPAAPLWRRLLIRSVERATGQPRLWRLYRDQVGAAPPADFFAEAIRRLDFRLRIAGNRFEAIPRQGPLVIVANHPCGVVDGLVLGYMISRVRPDFRILAHSALARVPELRDHLLPIDFSETRAAAQINLETRRIALADLAAGRVVVIFPNGAVSTARRPWSRSRDGQWKTFVARLVHNRRCDVLPIFFPGQNGWLSRLVSQVSGDLRHSLLFREVVGRMGREVEAVIGPRIPYQSLVGIADRRHLTDELRARTYALDPLPAAARPPEAFDDWSDPWIDEAFCPYSPARTLT